MLYFHELRFNLKRLYESVRSREDVSYAAWKLVHDAVHPARAFWYGCCNLYAYIPIIWYDRNWDQHYMFELWAKKFDRMAYSHLHYGNHVGHEETARQLRVCASLCRRINADEYHDVDQERHDAKWGKTHFRLEPTEHRTKKLFTDRENVRTEADEKLEREEFLRWMKKGDKMKQDDLNYLAKLVSNNALGWWD